MKIIFLLTQDLKSPSGLGRYQPIARELSRQGHTIKVYALHPDFNNLPQKSTCEDGLCVEYVAPMHVSKKNHQKSYYSMPVLIWLVIRATFALLRAALRERVDVIWIGKPHPMNGVAGLIAWCIWKCPLILDCDDDEVGSGRFGNRWQRSMIGFFERSLPRMADWVIVNTMHTFEKITTYGVQRSKIIYMPNGVDLERFSGPISEGRIESLKTQLSLSGSQVISYIGTLSRSSHAVDLLIDAFNILHKSLPEARLLLVGSGEDYETIHAQVNMLGLETSILFTGRIPPNQILDYYRLSEITIDPIYNNPAAMGRSPLKMFEAWVCGTPFISSPVGDRPMLAGDPPAAHFVHAGDAQSLADGMKDLLAQPERRKELVLLGYERLHAYTWGHLVERIGFLFR